MLSKKASADRIKELLGVLNFLASPFGSAEHLLINYGVKDTDYKLDNNGNPVLTDKGKADTNSPWTYISRPPTSIFDANARDFANLQNDEKADLAAGVADPTLGYYSPTYGATGTLLAQKFNDTIAEIIAGTRPLTDYDAAVSDWRSGGGDKIKPNKPLFEYRFAAQTATRPVKVALVNIDYLRGGFDAEGSRPAYSGIEEFEADAVLDPGVLDLHFPDLDRDAIMRAVEPAGRRILPSVQGM